MKFNITDDHTDGVKKASFVDTDFSRLETELKDYAIKQEVQSVSENVCKITSHYTYLKDIFCCCVVCI